MSVIAVLFAALLGSSARPDNAVAAMRIASAHLECRLIRMQCLSALYLIKYPCRSAYNNHVGSSRNTAFSSSPGAFYLTDAPHLFTTATGIGRVMGAVRGNIRSWPS
jgi:hypothetical protein